MHELSIMQSVIEICESSSGGSRVLSVTMEVGDLAGVVAEAAEFCFEACSRGTIVEGARLRIERIAGAGSCTDCGAGFGIQTYYDPCPACGSHAVMVTAGEELRVKELEVA